MKLGIPSIIILILVGLFLGLAISGIPTYIMLSILGGIFIVFLAFFRPLIIIAVLLVIVPFNMLWMGSGITPLEIAYGSTYVVLVIFWILKKVLKGIFSSADKSASGGKDRTESLASPITLPLVTFLCVSILSCAIGIIRGHSFPQWGSDLNAIMYYSLCFIMLSVVKNKKELYKLFSLLLCSTVLGLLKSTFYPNLGNSYMWIKSDVLESVKLRAVNMIGVGIFIISVAIYAGLARGRKKDFYAALSIFFGAMLIYSFVRSVWIAAVSSLSFLFFMPLEKRKYNVIKLSLISIFLFSIYLSIAMSLPSHNTLFRWVYALEKRYESIFVAKDEPSITTRGSEWKEATKRSLQHPFFGNGLGTQITFFTYDKWSYANPWKTTRYIHNAYIFLFLNMGLLGLISFLWLCKSFIKYGMTLYRSLEDEMDKSFSIGVTAAFICWMIVSLAEPILVSPILTMFVGFFMGALIILDKSQRGEEAL